MEPIEKKWCNAIFAGNQPEYKNLPAHIDDKGVVISCWKLSWWERLVALFAGKMILCVSTFNKPLQPVQMFFGEIKEDDYGKI